MASTLRSTVGIAAFAALALATAPSLAQKVYGPGVTDTEIKLGNTNPYSGPASSYGTIGKTLKAFWAMVNAEGGINGRKINFVTMDDGYSPPKTKEQVRKLVESEKVLAIFQSLGTPTNSAVHTYVNRKKVPHLFVATGATKWGDPKNFPWTMGWQPNYQTEGRIYARYLLANKPDARIGVLYQNDDAGKDYLKGMRDGLGDKADSMVVAVETYETTDPTVDSQVVNLKHAGANVFYLAGIPKFSAQAIRKKADIGWDALTLLTSVNASVSATLKPAGLAASQGIISTVYLKDPTDESWKDDPEYKEWLAFMDTYYPEGDKAEPFNVYGYAAGLTMKHVLENCGDNLSRENLMKQVANIRGFHAKMLLPGILINTSPTDFFPIETMQMQRFEGERWIRFGDPISSESS